MTMKIFLMVPVLLLATGSILAAAGGTQPVCAPTKMVKATLRNATPDLDPDSFAAKPRTYYRLGTRYGRVEDQLDTEHGVHGLMVASEPDLWMINLLNKKGKHIIDKQPPQHFHVPLLALPGNPASLPEDTASAFLMGFELGCELEYVKAQSGGAPPKPEQLDGHTYDAYTATQGEHKIVLLIDPATGKPFSATSLKSGKVITHVVYVEYDAGLAPDLSLFVPPKDVRFLER